MENRRISSVAYGNYFPLPDPDFEDEQPDLNPDDVFVVVDEDDGSDDAVEAFY